MSCITLHHLPFSFFTISFTVFHHPTHYLSLCPFAFIPSSISEWNPLPHSHAVTHQRTYRNHKCAREDCSKSALKGSKYCSDQCGILVATAKIEQLQHELLQDDAESVQTPSVAENAVAIAVNDDEDEDSTGAAAEQEDYIVGYTASGRRTTKPAPLATTKAKAKPKASTVSAAKKQQLQQQQQQERQLKLQQAKMERSEKNLNLLWDAVSSVNKLETVIKAVEPSSTATATAAAATSARAKDEQDENGSTEPVEAVASLPNGSMANSGLDLQDRIKEEQTRLSNLQVSLSDLVTRRQSLENKLASLNARLSYLHLAIKKWEQSCSYHAQHNIKPSAANKKNKPNTTAAVSADAPCGFDVRLVWSDEDWEEWLESGEGREMMELAAGLEDGSRTLPPYKITEAGQAGDTEGVAAEMQEGEKTAEDGAADEDEEEGMVCTLTRRKCDRHAAWQKLREADYQVDRVSTEKQLATLAETERRTRRRVEDIQDFLRKGTEKMVTLQAHGIQVSAAVTRNTLDDDADEEEREEDLAIVDDSLMAVGEAPAPAVLLKA